MSVPHFKAVIGESARQIEHGLMSFDFLIRLGAEAGRQEQRSDQKRDGRKAIHFASDFC
jgi:hypothetical protein